MMRTLTPLLFVWLAASGAHGESLKILGVGNNFTRKSTKYLSDIAKAGKVDLDIGVCYIGG
jgi:hypothetical protein